MTLIKICGLTTPEMLDAAVAAGATHIGLMYVAKSPRYITLEAGAALAARLPAHVASVGVFADADDALLAAAAPFLDVLQLHGNESPARVAETRRHGREVWRAIGVTTRADITAAIQAARGVADRLLFDAKPPSGMPLSGGVAAVPPLGGGNGLRFDWQLLAQTAPDMPWGLAGGIDAGNVAEAIALTRAPLVDVSSGVEDAPGVKSVEKIRAFVAAVRA